MNVILANNQKHFADVFRIRTNVFIGEQEVPAHEEIDELDCFVPLFLAYNDEGLALGTARVIVKEEKIAKIGRVAVERDARRLGVGRTLMLAAIEHINSQTEVAEIQLDAQVSAIPFYESLGFSSYGEEFLDAGITHVGMKLKLNR